MANIHMPIQIALRGHDNTSIQFKPFFHLASIQSVKDETVFHLAFICCFFY